MPNFDSFYLTYIKSLNDLRQLFNDEKKDLRDIACVYQETKFTWADIRTVYSVLEGYSNKEAAENFNITDISHCTRKTALAKKLKCSISGYHLYRECLRFLFNKLDDLL